MIEELHEDLKMYLDKDTDLGDFIKHPLLFWAGYDDSFIEVINSAYKAKLKEAEKERKAKKWENWLRLHERPYRLDAFMSIASELDKKNYWELLSRIWIDTEFPTVNKDIWIQLFTRKLPNKRKLMSGKERRVLARLPDKDINVFRGYSDDEHADGISWTLSYEKAEEFAKRWGSEDAKIAEGMCKKEDILAFLNGRNEEEIIIDPEKVRVLRSQGILITN